MVSARSGISSLVRLSVSSGTRRADLGVPSGLPVAELVPDLARELGVLDAAVASRGHRLLKADGTTLDMTSSLAAQGIEDGSVLLLEPASAREKVYDDVVEAVADLVESRFTPWSAAHASLTAIGAAVTFFLAAAYALFTARGQGALITAVAGAAALLLVGAATVLLMVRKQMRAATALGLTALVYAVVAGFSARPDAPLWGEGLVYAGAACSLVALIAAAAITPQRATFLALAVAGAALGAIGALATFVGWPMTSICSVGFVVAAILACVLPWVGLSSSRLSSHAPKADSEVWADVPLVDPHVVAGQVERGHSLMLGVGLATGIGMLVTTPQLVSAGMLGTTLVLVGFAAVLLGTRHARTRASVLLAMVTGIAGIALATIAAVQTHASWRPWLALALASAAAVIVAMAMVIPRTRLRMGRIADALSGACLVALVPLAWFAADIL